MEYRNLGKSDLKVPVLGLGTNNFGWWIDEPASSAVINHALEIGINYIDTADMYDNGRSEEFIGRILKGRRKEVLIATKFGMPMGEGINDRRLAGVHHQGLGGQPEKAPDRLRRPVSDAPI